VPIDEEEEEEELLLYNYYKHVPLRNIAQLSMEVL
jgi:hypothetical protein